MSNDDDPLSVEKRQKLDLASNRSEFENRVSNPVSLRKKETFSLLLYLKLNTEAEIGKSEDFVFNT